MTRSMMSLGNLAFSEMDEESEARGLDAELIGEPNETTVAS